MTMRRTIIYILVILVLTVAANFWMDRATSIGAVRNRPLLDSNFEVRSISITRPDEAKLLLRKTVRWTLAAPFAGAADEETVLRLVDTFAAASVSDVLSDAELLKLGRTRDDFGFSGAGLKLVFSDGERDVSFTFGDLTPSSNGVYVAVSGLDALLVVPAQTRAAVPARADAFRARSVFPFEPNFVVGFDVQRATAPVLGLAREGEGWMVNGRVASEAKVRDFLVRMSEAKVIDFLWPTESSAEDEILSEARLSAYGLDADSALSVVFRCMDGVDRRILLGRDEGDGRTYALLPNGEALVTLSSSIKEALVRGRRDFVDLRIFPVEESQVGAFSIQKDGVSYALARETGGAWRLDSPIAAPASPDVVSALVGRLVTLSSADVVPEGLKVSVSTNLSSYVVSQEALLGAYRLEDLRSKEILSIDPAHVRRLVATFGGKTPLPPFAVTYSRERQTWDVESDENSNLTADESSIRQVLSVIASLQATRVVSIAITPSDWTNCGFESPYFALAVDQDRENAVRRNILIGSKAKGGGRYATVGSSDALFVLSKETVETLTRPLVED